MVGGGGSVKVVLVTGGGVVVEVVVDEVVVDEVVVDEVVVDESVVEVVPVGRTVFVEEVLVLVVVGGPGTKFENGEHFIPTRLEMIERRLVT